MVLLELHTHTSCTPLNQEAGREDALSTAEIRELVAVDFHGEKDVVHVSGIHKVGLNNCTATTTIISATVATEHKTLPLISTCTLQAIFKGPRGSWVIRKSG